MLVLNAQDISHSISYAKLIESIEEAFQIQETGNFTMPQRMHIEQNENVLLLMPAFIEDFFATKLISVFPENKNHNQPIIQGKLLLNDTKTGSVLALMDATKLTALRTAAVGAVAIKHLHKKPLNTLGLIGAGIQGFHQIILAHQVYPFQNVIIYDPFISQSGQEIFVKDINKELSNVTCFFTSNSESVLTQSDLIITATTSESPVLPNNKELFKGKTIIAIGSYKPIMRELPESTFSRVNQVFIDTPAAVAESGDLVIPLKNNWIQEENIHTLGKLINGKIKLGESETIVFKSVGMALFDLVVAKEVFKQVVSQNAGTKIKD